MVQSIFILVGLTLLVLGGYGLLRVRRRAGHGDDQTILEPSASRAKSPFAWGPVLLLGGAGVLFGVAAFL